MTNSVNSSAIGDEKRAKFGLSKDFTADPCGENLDWSRGVEGLRAELGRSTNLSGALLTKVIEREIIPRLFLSHCDLSTSTQIEVAPPDLFAAVDTEALTRLVLSGEPADKIMDQVQYLLDRGITLQRIYLDLLAPIARRLGEFWEEDRCTFIDMTLALSRLHWVLRELGQRRGEGTRRSISNGRVYLVPFPGEQHTFGLMMVEEFFLHAGWEMASDRDPSNASILQMVSQQHIDVIGFSVCSESYLGPLGDLTRQIRQSSINRDIGIMVGGAIFKDNAGLARLISDATIVADGVTAVEVAENLLPQTCLSR